MQTRLEAFEAMLAAVMQEYRQTAEKMAALKAHSRGTFRVPGKAPFAMFRSLTAEAQAPGYFGLAFD